MPREGRLSQLCATSAGLIAWAAQFTIIYGATAVACARGYAQTSIGGVDVVRLIILATTLLALGVTAIALFRALRTRRGQSNGGSPTDQFVNTSAILIGGLSLVVIAWQGLPAFIVPVCS
jgi:hypothetical protein